MLSKKELKLSDCLNNKPESFKYNCFYCNESANLDDLVKVDKKLKKMDPEEHEFLLDNLQNSNNLRVPPFIHKCDLGYEVLNICIKCFERAKNTNI